MTYPKRVLIAIDQLFAVALFGSASAECDAITDYTALSVRLTSL